MASKRNNLDALQKTALNSKGKGSGSQEQAAQKGAQKSSLKPNSNPVIRGASRNEPSHHKNKH
jgi:hypothetical protein